VVPTALWDIDQDMFVQKEHLSIRPLPHAHLGWTSLKFPTLFQQGDTTQLDVENIPPLQEEDLMTPSRC
jgi:hypothetical protein